MLRLAVAALFLGIQQPSLLLPQPWTTHVLIGYVAWLATFRLLLLLHKHFFVSPAAPDSKDTQCILPGSSLLLRWVGDTRPYSYPTCVLFSVGYHCVGANSQTDLSVVLGVCHQIFHLGPAGFGKCWSPGRFVGCYW